MVVFLIVEFPLAVQANYDFFVIFDAVVVYGICFSVVPDINQE
jgi:hypothetical protein